VSDLSDFESDWVLSHTAEEINRVYSSTHNRCAATDSQEASRRH